MEIMSSMIVFALVMLAHTKVVGNGTQFALALTYSSTLTYLMNLLLKSAANVEAEVWLRINTVEILAEGRSVDELCRTPHELYRQSSARACCPSRF